MKRQIGAVTALSVLGVLALSGTAAAMNVRVLNSRPTISSFGTAEAFVDLDQQPGVTASPSDASTESSEPSVSPSASVKPSATPGDTATPSAHETQRSWPTSEPGSAIEHQPRSPHIPHLTSRRTSHRQVTGQPGQLSLKTRQQRRVLPRLTDPVGKVTRRARRAVVDLATMVVRPGPTEMFRTAMDREVVGLAITAAMASRATTSYLGLCFDY